MDTATKVTEPLVSILMLTYNRARYITEAIDSIFKQTYTNWQLIIIDDGSTDDTRTAVARYTDSRIRYVRHEENRGLLVRRQESLTYIRGAYIAILDSDDVWLDHNKLTKQVAHLEANPTCVLIGTALTRINENGEKIGESHYETDDVHIREKILRRNQFAHSSILMRQTALAHTAGYRFPLAEDLDLFLQLGLLGTFANLREPMTGYRIHPGSETGRRRAMIDAVLSIINTHRQYYPHFISAYFKYKLYAFILRLLYRFSR